MPVEPSWKKWARRVWSLGYSRLFMVLAILFGIVALATPMWALTEHGDPGEWHTSTYGWAGVSTDNYRNSAYDGSTYLPYSGPSFHDYVLSSAIGASFTLIVVYAVLLAIVAALFSTEWAKTMPRLGLLIVVVFVVLVALAALFYPLLTVPNAAATNLGFPAVSGGFWGSIATPDVLNWGAGLAWWLLLIAVILGAVGVALPYLQSMRGTPYPPPPQAWHPPQ